MKRLVWTFLLAACFSSPAYASDCANAVDCLALAAVWAAIVGGLIIAALVLGWAWPLVAGFLAEGGAVSLAGFLADESGAIAIDKAAIGLGVGLAGEVIETHPELVDTIVDTRAEIGEAIGPIVDELGGELSTLEETLGGGISEEIEAAQDADRAIEYAKSLPNTVSHIFDDPKHLWNATGLDQNGNWNLIQETIEQNYGQISGNAVFKVTQQFGSYSVTVQGQNC